MKPEDINLRRLLIVFLLASALHAWYCLTHEVPPVYTMTMLGTLWGGVALMLVGLFIQKWGVKNNRDDNGAITQDSVNWAKMVFYWLCVIPVISILTLLGIYMFG